MDSTDHRGTCKNILTFLTIVSPPGLEFWEIFHPDAVFLTRQVLIKNTSVSQTFSNPGPIKPDFSYKPLNCTANHSQLEQPIKMVLWTIFQPVFLFNFLFHGPIKRILADHDLGTSLSETTKLSQGGGVNEHTLFSWLTLPTSSSDFWGCRTWGRPRRECWPFEWLTYWSLWTWNSAPEARLVEPEKQTICVKRQLGVVQSDTTVLRGQGFYDYRIIAWREVWRLGKASRRVSKMAWRHL